MAKNNTHTHTFSLILLVVTLAVLGFYEGIVALCFNVGVKTKAAIDMDDPNFITLGEIHTANGVNTWQNVQALYNAIAGEENTTLDDIKTLSQTDGGYNAGDMRAHNDDKDIRVTFGGYVWHVVYLSQDMNHRPILTLWLASDQDIPTSTWSSGWCYDGTDAMYPSNLYGTSYIRAVTLNNGGRYAMDSQGRTGYAGDSIVLSPNVTPDANHVLKKFTVPTAVNNVISNDEIVTPALVKWQKDEQNAKTRFGEHYFTYRFNNENWDDSSNSDGWYSDALYYDKADNRCHAVYANWNTDNLWLPSLTETGWYTSNNSKAGLWGLSQNQLRGDRAWLRTGSCHYNNYAYQLYEGGNKHLTDTVDTWGGVRPALHINLESDAITTKQPITANYVGGGWTFGESTNLPTVTFGDEKLTLAYTAHYTDANGDPITELSNYAGPVHMTVTLNDPNYVVLGDIGYDFTIIGVEKFAGDVSVYYDGTTHTLANINPYWYDGVTVVGDEPVMRNVGEYNVTVRKAGYVDQTIKVTVLPKTVTVAMSQGGWLIGGTVNTPTANLSGVVDGDDVTVTVKCYDQDNHEVTAWTVGDYTAKVTFGGADKDNYTFAGTLEKPFAVSDDISGTVNDNNQPNLAWILWGVIGGVVIVGIGLIIFLVVKTRKPKVNPAGV